MGSIMKRVETRLIPEETNLKFYMEHLKPYEFIKKNAKGKSILEIGFGDGYGSAYLAKVASKVVSIDYEEAVVLTAKNKYIASNLSFIYMDATKLQFEDASFDIVCSFQVIEHIPEEKLLQYLSEINRVLKDDGEFYLSTLNLEHVMKSPLTYEKQPAHCKEFKLNELSDLLYKVFPHLEIYGLAPTLKHRFYLKLKRIGSFNFLPEKINPVKRFYNKVTTADFKITSNNLRKASDFVCICRKNNYKLSKVKGIV